ncbi:MAG: hypothetical protein ACFFCS_14205 [Candidatus Hodarchaeota archaeon]
MKTGKSLVYSDKQLEKINRQIPVVTCPKIYKQAGIYLPGKVEATPIVFQGNLLTVTFCREASHGTGVQIHDFFTKKLVKDFSWDYGLGCAIVIEDEIRLFGSTDWENAGNAIYTSILVPEFEINPDSTQAVYQANPDQQIYNSSVSGGASPGEYIMAYEVREPDTKPFSIRFLHSTDLVTWDPIGTIFQPGIYAACPTIRYSDGWYYIIYLEHRRGYVECISRTKDFLNFDNFSGNPELGPNVQVLSAKGYLHEGLNNSDIDMVEYKGITYFVYADGDQRSWDDMRTAIYLGSMDEFFKEFWRD